MIKLFGTVNTIKSLQGNVKDSNGIYSYNDLPDKPQINNIQIEGNKTANDLNLQLKMSRITNTEIDKMFKEKIK